MKWTWTALCISALGLVSCSSDDSSSSEQPAVKSFAVCSYDFSATVRSGPSAPFEVSGDLLLMKSSDSVLSGSLRLSDGTMIAASGTLSGQALALRFGLADGREIHGEGKLTQEFSACESPLEGSLTGPSEGDQGDWIGKRKMCIADCNTCINDACDSLCPCDGIFGSAACNACFQCSYYSCQSRCYCP